MDGGVGLMLQWQKVEIAIRGLAEKEGALARAPGTLRRALNVEFDKAGELNKRRGYRRVGTSVDLQGNTMERVFCGVMTYGTELLLYGHEFLYTVSSERGEVDGASCIRRGPVLRGNYTTQHIVSSSLGSEVLPEEEA